MAYGYRRRYYRRPNSLLRSFASGYRIGGINIARRNAALRAGRTWPIPRRIIGRRAPLRIPPRLLGRVRAFSAMNSGAEQKYNDATEFTNAIPVTGFVNQPNMQLEQTSGGAQGSYCGIAQGVGRSQRIGRRFNITCFRYHGVFVFANPIGGTAGLYFQNDVVRIILVVDKQCSGAGFNVTDLLKNANIDSFMNMDTTDRFIVLKDFRITITNPGPVTTQIMSGAGAPSSVYSSSRMYRAFKFTVRFRKPLPIQCNNTSGGIAGIQNNNLAMMMITQNGIIALADSFARVYYDDN